MRTKWEILTARLVRAEREVAELRDAMAGLERTPCGLKCSGCATPLTTEADFARHFLIPEERLLNVGVCPHVTGRDSRWRGTVADAQGHLDMMRRNLSDDTRKGLRDVLVHLVWSEDKADELTARFVADESRVSVAAELARFPRPCWNGRCIIEFCDGVGHSDYTGHSWSQRRGFEYNPASGAYDRPVGEGDGTVVSFSDRFNV
jgi:hypothetical protein